MKSNKNILIVSCVFPPETVVSAKTSFDIAKRFAEDGHSVSVICPKPSRNVDVGNLIDNSPNIKVMRLRTPVSNNSSFISRFLENIVFGLRVFIKILFSKKYDSVYVNAWPIFSIGLIGLACKIRKFKVVSAVQDLYPESLVAQKRIKKGGFVYDSLLFLDKLSVKFMSNLLVISPSFKTAYVEKRKYDESKIVLFNNWLNLSSFNGLKVNEARSELSDKFGINLGNEFVTVYGGNIGVAAGIYDFVRKWSDVENAGVFLLAGAGSELGKIHKFIKDNSLGHKFKILSPWPDSASEAVLSAADVLALPIGEGQESASVPSKMISYMYAARPILMVTDCDSLPAKILSTSNAGFVVNHEDNFQFKYNEIRAFSKEELIDVGINGKNYAKENYSFEPNFSKIRELMLNG